MNNESKYKQVALLGSWFKKKKKSQIHLFLFGLFPGCILNTEQGLMQNTYTGVYYSTAAQRI